MLRETIRATGNLDGLLWIALSASDQRLIPPTAMIVDIESDAPDVNVFGKVLHPGRLSVTFEWPAPKTEEEMVHG